jgi:hypothetical protein
MIDAFYLITLLKKNLDQIPGNPSIKMIGELAIPFDL